MYSQNYKRGRLTVGICRALCAATIWLFAAGHAYAAVGNPRVNQVGYAPNATKVATVATSLTAPVSWELRQSGNVVLSGMTAPFGMDAATGENVHLIDFSSFNIEGSSYTLHVGADQSHPFNVAVNIFRSAKYDALRYFYHNRSGIAIQTQFTGGGNGSYPANSLLSRPAGHLNVSPNRGDSNVPCWPGTCSYSLNVTKGWYDAGDHGKYVVNGGISVWQL